MRLLLVAPPGLPLRTGGKVITGDPLRARRLPTGDGVSASVGRKVRGLLTSVTRWWSRVVGRPGAGEGTVRWK